MESVCGSRPKCNQKRIMIFKKIEFKSRMKKASINKLAEAHEHHKEYIGDVISMSHLQIDKEVVEDGK